MEEPPTAPVSQHSRFRKLWRRLAASGGVLAIAGVTAALFVYQFNLLSTYDPSLDLRLLVCATLFGITISLFFLALWVLFGIWEIGAISGVMWGSALAFIFWMIFNGALHS